MIRTLSYVAILALAAPALAQQPQQPAGQPAGQQPSEAAADMTRYGPWTRPVTKQDKKGIDQLYKAMEDAWKKGDVEALANNIDFPVIMLSDNSRGEARHFEATREEWIGFMKPFVTAPKEGMKMSHKHNVHFLSDTLAVSIEDNSVSGKMNAKWKSMSVLNKKGDVWKVKEMSEAGWGDMTPTDTASEKPRQPTNTLPATLPTTP
jgi:ketosteroid isomerase-like protein